MTYRAHVSFSRAWRGSVAGRAVLQRKCDCGSHTGGGECEDCAEKKQEIQRKGTGAAVDAVPPIVHDVLGESGRALDAEQSASMGASFGRDFSGVRIHTDARAAESARAIRAQAYTVGRDIVFGSGEYQPETRSGRHLLAHELAHVVQQDAATPAVPADIAFGDSASGEAAADRAADGIANGTNAEHAVRSDVGIQRQAADESESAPAGGTDCIEEVVGEDIPSLLQSGAVTVLEFGAPWCGGCVQNRRGLEELCKKFRTNPPPVQVRIYSINVDTAGNEEARAKYGDGKYGSLPQLYFYVGSTQKARYDQGIEPDAMAAIVGEQIEYASQSGAWRGAKKGAKWGMIPGAAVGLAGAIAVGAKSGLEGNSMMLGVLGTLAGGVAAGALIGGAIGAIAGAVGDDRNTGPKQQKRRKLQPKRRDASTSDPLERDADAWADRVAGDPAPARANARGEALDVPTRATMETHFGRDFGDVRLHRDADAHALAVGMDAYAVTRGSDIYFAADGYAPDTAHGRSILGHELAHVAQNASTGVGASESTLESEADRASMALGTGARADVRHASRQPQLAIKRWQKTLAGIGIGLAGGGLLGAGAGAGIAALTGGSVGGGALLGGLIGAGAGLIAGGLYGFFARNTTPEGIAETEALIQKRYGKYLRGGATGPLHNANVHVVSHTELCERNCCRTGHACDPGMVGWTDTGPQISPSLGPQHQSAPTQTQAPQPACCHGKQMEPASVEHPVIYYQRESKLAGTLMHEALHAHSHPDYAFLHNAINEGTTEYFTRKLQDDINMPYGNSAYADPDSGNWLGQVEKLVGLVGEETVARAYFGGAVPALHAAVNAKLGPCALITWAFSLQMESYRQADAIFEGRNQDYCKANLLPGVDPKSLTPSLKPAGQNAAQPQGAKREEKTP